MRFRLCSLGEILSTPFSGLGTRQAMAAELDPSAEEAVAASRFELVAAILHEQAAASAVAGAQSDLAVTVADESSTDGADFVRKRAELAQEAVGSFRAAERELAGLVDAIRRAGAGRDSQSLTARNNTVLALGHAPKERVEDLISVPEADVSKVGMEHELSSTQIAALRRRDTLSTMQQRLKEAAAATRLQSAKSSSWTAQVMQVAHRWPHGVISAQDAHDRAIDTVARARAVLLEQCETNLSALPSVAPTITERAAGLLAARISAHNTSSDRAFVSEYISSTVASELAATRCATATSATGPLALPFEQTSAARAAREAASWAPRSLLGGDAASAAAALRPAPFAAVVCAAWAPFCVPTASLMPLQAVSSSAEEAFSPTLTPAGSAFLASPAQRALSWAARAAQAWSGSALPPAGAVLAQHWALRVDLVGPAAAASATARARLVDPHKAELPVVLASATCTLGATAGSRLLSPVHRCANAVAAAQAVCFMAAEAGAAASVEAVEVHGVSPVEAAAAAGPLACLWLLAARPGSKATEDEASSLFSLLAATVDDALAECQQAMHSASTAALRLAARQSIAVPTAGDPAVVTASPPGLGCLTRRIECGSVSFQLRLTAQPVPAAMAEPVAASDEPVPASCSSPEGLCTVAWQSPVLGGRAMGIRRVECVTEASEAGPWGCRAATGAMEAILDSCLGEDAVVSASACIHAAAGAWERAAVAAAAIASCGLSSP